MAATWTVPASPKSALSGAGQSSRHQRTFRFSRTALNVSATGIAAAGVLVFAMGASRPSVMTSVVDGWTRMIGPAVLGFVFAVIVVEQVRPAEPRPLLSRGHLHDMVYLALYALVVAPFVVILNESFVRMVVAVAPWIALPLAAHLPGLAAFSLAFLVMDGCNWLGHWANHRWRAFWRFHAVHHSQEELSVLTTFRAHPLVHVSFLLSVLPVVALSSGVALPLAVIAAYVCANALTHANLRWSYGPLGRVFVSPMYHRLHHEYGADMGLNLGAVLTVWDLLSRRAAFPNPATKTPPTGLAARHIPLEQGTTPWRPLSVLLAQWTEPFARLQTADEGRTSGGSAAKVAEAEGLSDRYPAVIRRSQR